MISHNQHCVFKDFMDPILNRLRNVFQMLDDFTVVEIKPSGLVHYSFLASMALFANTTKLGNWTVWPNKKPHFAGKKKKEKEKAKMKKSLKKGHT